MAKFYCNYSIKALKDMLQERELDQEDMTMKGSMIATLLAHDLNLINTVSYKGGGASPSGASRVRMMRRIHESIAGRGIPAVAGILGAMNCQTRKDALMTAIMYLEAHAIYGNYNISIPVEKDPAVLHDVLIDLQSIMNVPQFLIANCLPFKYEPLPHITECPGEKTFTIFGRLPFEIRTMIWKMTANARIVTIIPHKGRSKMTAPFPMLLAVNYESRKIGLELYHHEKRIAPDKKEFFVNYFDLDVDTLFFNNRSTLYFDARRGFIERYIDADLCRGVENIAIGHAFHGNAAIRRRTFPRAKNAIYVMSLSTDPVIFDPHGYHFQDITVGLLPKTLRDVYSQMDPGKGEARYTFGSGRKWLKQAQVDIIKDRVKAQGRAQFGKKIKVAAVEAVPYLRDRLF